VRFRHDVWCKDQPLKIQFLDTFLGWYLLKNATVQDVVSWNGAQSHWNISFSRILNDWEDNKVCSFLATLAKINVLPEGIDKIVWTCVPNSPFTIKSFSEKLHGGGNCSHFPIKAIWTSKAPTKVCFFAWAATKGKIPTADATKRRYFNGPSRCSMCLKDEETVDHLLIHCR